MVLGSNGATPPRLGWAWLWQNRREGGSIACIGRSSSGLPATIAPGIDPEGFLDPLEMESEKAPALRQHIRLSGRACPAFSSARTGPCCAPRSLAWQDARGRCGRPDPRSLARSYGAQGFRPADSGDRVSAPDSSAAIVSEQT